MALPVLLAPLKLVLDARDTTAGQRLIDAMCLSHEIHAARETGGSLPPFLQLLSLVRRAKNGTAGPLHGKYLDTSTIVVTLYDDLHDVLFDAKLGQTEKTALRLISKCKAACMRLPGLVGPSNILGTQQVACAADALRERLPRVLEDDSVATHATEAARCRHVLRLLLEAVAELEREPQHQAAAEPPLPLDRTEADPGCRQQRSSRSTESQASEARQSPARAAPSCTAREEAPEPAPLKPAVSEPAPLKPAVSEPAPLKPAMSDPVPVKPAAAKPALTKSGGVQAPASVAIPQRCDAVRRLAAEAAPSSTAASTPRGTSVSIPPDGSEQQPTRAQGGHIASNPGRKAGQKQATRPAASRPAPKGESAPKSTPPAKKTSGRAPLKQIAGQGSLLAFFSKGSTSSFA